MGFVVLRGYEAPVPQVRQSLQADFQVVALLDLVLDDDLRGVPRSLVLRDHRLSLAGSLPNSATTPLERMSVALFKNQTTKAATTVATIAANKKLSTFRANRTNAETRKAGHPERVHPAGFLSERLRARLSGCAGCSDIRLWGVDSDRTGKSSDSRRLTVPEAAEALGVTGYAVRGRIRREILEAEREAGTVYDFLDLEESDRREPSWTSRTPSDDQSELVAQLLDRVASLERQLERHWDETERMH